MSNLRAIGIFSLFPDELPNCAGQPYPAFVRNIVSVHFVAFIARRKEKPRHAGGVLSKLRSGLVRFAQSQETESREAHPKQRECCRLGDGRTGNLAADFAPTEIDRMNV